MTPLGWIVAAAVGAIVLLGAALLIRWLRGLEAERIEAIAARRGWRVDGGSGPSDWRVEGEDAGLRWVLGVRQVPRRGPITELTVAAPEAAHVLFAAPRSPAPVPASAERWVAEVFGREAPGVRFVEGPAGWTVATDDPKRGGAWLTGEAAALQALRPTLERHGAVLRLRLPDEVRDGPTLEALVDLGLRLARR